MIAYFVCLAGWLAAWALLGWPWPVVPVAALAAYAIGFWRGHSAAERHHAAHVRARIGRHLDRELVARAEAHRKEAAWN